MVSTLVSVCVGFQRMLCDEKFSDNLIDVVFARDRAALGFAASEHLKQLTTAVQAP